jgi:hypothetical protein
MVWTAMPEAAVDEHSYSCAGKEQVCTPTQAGKRGIDPVAEPTTMQ